MSATNEQALSERQCGPAAYVHLVLFTYVIASGDRQVGIEVAPAANPYGVDMCPPATGVSAIERQVVPDVEWPPFFHRCARVGAFVNLKVCGTDALEEERHQMHAVGEMAQQNRCMFWVWAVTNLVSVLHKRYLILPFVQESGRMVQSSSSPSSHPSPPPV